MFHVPCFMIVGLDGSRAFLKQRTGIEEYSYQVIKNLRENLKSNQVFLYVRSGQKVDFSLPKNWKIKIINWPYLWTQIGLSLEIFFHPVDALFIPAHIVPIIHPKNTVVVIHGLEYEFVPEAYPWWEKMYMRWAIKKSCRWAQKIIAVSENTKNDLMKLYKVPEEKIKVVYEGISPFGKGGIEGGFEKLSEIKNPSPTLPFQKGEKPFLLFIGRLEERKNIIGIIKAFEILKEKYKIPHKLILAGKPGFGYAKVITKIQETRYKDDIILSGFIGKEEKRELLKNADVFLFPTFYEGFGLPILEAQDAGVPVVASIEASIPEVVKIPLLPLGEGARRADEGALQNAPHPNPLPEGEGARDFSALLVNPKNPSAIAEAAYKLISDKNLKDEIIKKGLENIKRFSWEKCASAIAKVIKN